MNEPKILFQKEYDSESLADVERAMWEAMDEHDLPQDEYGFDLGTFKFTVEWIPEESSDEQPTT